MALPGRLEAGEGIGRDCIMAFAPMNAFTEDQVRNALGTLKDSGRMATIIAEAHANTEAERAASAKATHHADRRLGAVRRAWLGPFRWLAPPQAQGLSSPGPV